MKSFILIIIFLKLVLSLSNYDMIQQIANEELLKVCPQRGFRGVEKHCNITYNNNQNQTKILPVNLGIGWDPVSGSIKLPVLQVTYNNKKMYNKFLVPDQFNLAVQNLLIPNRYTQTYHLPSEFFGNIDITRTQIKGGIFASSQDMYNKIIQYFGAGEQTMTLVQEFHTAFDLTYDTKINVTKQLLNNSFKKALAYLPTNYQENKDIYKLFLYYWGTEVVTSGQVGGVAEQITNIKECFYGESINMENQAELTILKTLYAQQYANAAYSASFLQYSKANILEIYGGDPTIVEYSRWTERLNSFEEYPVFTDVSVISILEFIDNSVIRNNVEQAINDYYVSGQLQMSSVITQWIDSWNAEKSVVSMPTVVTSDDHYMADKEVYMVQKFWKYPNIAINGARSDFTIGTMGENLVDICGDTPGYTTTNEVQELTCLQYFADIRNVYCKRDANGYMYAYMDPAANMFPWVNQGWYQTSQVRLQISVGEGTHVKQGTSFVEGYLIGPSGPALPFKHSCFTGCAPQVINVQTENNIYWSYTRGNLICTCPPF